VGATLIVVPVLHRPHRVAPLLASIDAATPEAHRVLFVLTRGDGDEFAAVAATGAHRMVVAPNPRGDYARKVNAAYRDSIEPFLFLAADDLHFHPGWLTEALAVMADETVGVVGTNDLGNARVVAGQHSTHSLVRRSYVERWGTIDEPGKILHEGYPHEYVDDEFVQTAMSRRAFRPCLTSIVEHLHPNWGKAPTDPLYEQQHARMRLGRKIYWRRQHLWRT
jgi:hypothetical protein